MVLFAFLVVQEDPIEDNDIGAMSRPSELLGDPAKFTTLRLDHRADDSGRREVVDNLFCVQLVELFWSRV